MLDASHPDDDFWWDGGSLVYGSGLTDEEAESEAEEETEEEAEKEKDRQKSRIISLFRLCSFCFVCVRFCSIRFLFVSFVCL